MKYILFILIFLVIPLASSTTYIQNVSLDINDVIITSITNTSMTFSKSISADLLIVENSSITFYNFTCLDTPDFYDELVLENINENQDSSVYCLVKSTTHHSGGDAVIFKKETNLFSIFSPEGKIKGNVIILLIIIIVSLILFYFYSKRKSNKKYLNFNNIE